MVVFDKAKWHFEGDFPDDLGEDQAYVHTGFFVGWLILNDLVSDELKTESAGAIEALKQRKLTPVEFYIEQLDGVFTSDDVNEVGHRFTEQYFDFEKGQYLVDYHIVLAGDLPSMYHVQGTWENFDKIGGQISVRFKELVQ